jgi:hypothetical protein
MLTSADPRAGDLTDAWTLQQVREAISFDGYRYLIHDGDSIFAKSLDGIHQAAPAGGPQIPAARPGGEFSLRKTDRHDSP